MNVLLPALLLSTLLAAALPAQAQLFKDNEARRAILDLRERVAGNERAHNEQLSVTAASQAALNEELSLLRRSLLEISSQLEALRSEVAQRRGEDERLLHAVGQLQREQDDLAQAVQSRLRAQEPLRVSLDGEEFDATPAQTAAWDDAMNLVRGGEFAGAATRLQAFVQRHAGSGYAPSARYWLGNALYAQREHARAIAEFQTFVATAPRHPRVPDALLSMATSQAEMRDTRAARQTLQTLVKEHPDSEAARLGAQRLAQLR
jgi:tol-pal system protein YbgF